MAMRPCEKCSANVWEFEKDDGLVVATCQNCWNEVSWMPKKNAENKQNTKYKKLLGRIQRLEEGLLILAQMIEDGQVADVKYTISVILEDE